MENFKASMTPRVALSREGESHLCHCCVLDVTAQGPTAAEARRNLIEAVVLFQESCAEIGSRDEIFNELGFHDSPGGVLPPACCYSRCCPCRPEED